MAAANRGGTFDGSKAGNSNIGGLIEGSMVGVMVVDGKTGITFHFQCQAWIMEHKPLKRLRHSDLACPCIHRQQCTPSRELFVVQRAATEIISGLKTITPTL